MNPYDPLAALSKRLSISRLLSLVVLAINLVISMIKDQPSAFFQVLACGLVPVFCIWWPDVLATMTSGALGWMGTSYEPPEGLIVGLGWVALLSPIWIVLLASLIKAVPS